MLKKYFLTLFLFGLFVTSASGEERKAIEIIPSKAIGGAATVIVRLQGSEPQEFSARTYGSPYSSQMPIGEEFNPWIWSQDKRYFIFSTLSKELVDYGEFFPFLKRETLKHFVDGPKMQTIYLVDIENQELSPIATLTPKDIYCLNQKFFIKDKNIFFSANKEYLIDIKNKKAVEVRE